MLSEDALQAALSSHAQRNCLLDSSCLEGVVWDCGFFCPFAWELSEPAGGCRLVHTLCMPSVCACACLYCAKAGCPLLHSAYLNPELPSRLLVGLLLVPNDLMPCRVSGDLLASSRQALPSCGGCRRVSLPESPVDTKLFTPPPPPRPCL